MREINLGRIIVSKRREKGVTQEELASTMGVSKAAVSKWETGQSYPDITLLPQLAAFFNISIDELIGYEPQMVKEDIRKLYYRLSEAFASRPYDEVLKECEEIVRKYYSCFPLLRQMAGLLLNHISLSNDPDRILEMVISLCLRVEKEGEDMEDVRQAVFTRSCCYLIQQKPEKVLELLGEDITPLNQERAMLAQAYLSLGKPQKAEEVLQTNMYQYLLSLIGDAVAFVLIKQDDMEKMEETVRRIRGVIDLYGVENMHPCATLNFYMACAQVYCGAGMDEKALGMLGEYVRVCTTAEELFMLRGDRYFDKVDAWVNNFELGNKAPLDARTVRQALITGVTGNPALSRLADNKDFLKMAEKLRSKLGGE